MTPDDLVIPDAEVFRESFQLLLVIWVVAVILMTCMAIQEIQAPTTAIGYKLRKKARQILPSKITGHESVPSVIGYKKAYVEHIEHDEGVLQDVTFKGMSWVRYGLNSEAESDSAGFHMFKRLTDAENHNQGNVSSVLIEVMGYGDMNMHRKGFETDHQRVLQLIIGTCNWYKCDQQAEFFIPPKTIVTGGYEARCSKHHYEDKRKIDLRPMMLQQNELLSGERLNICPRQEVEYKWQLIPAFDQTVVEIA